MQSTHKIPGSSATTWSRYLISKASRGDYYTHDGKDGESAPTGWHGPDDLLRSYGIDPNKPVELEHLRSLMHGFSPVDGEPIRPAGSDRTRVAAIDLTYSPPKDVSALWATAGPYRRAQIEVAHRKAVKSALERTEREVALVRRKTDGIIRFEQAKRLLAVESVHTTSRLAKDQDAQGIPDPQLHSHVAVIAAQRHDGKLAALESRQLFLAARESGAWYRSELAANLNELGLPIERRAGKNERYFAIQGVSKELSEHWSKRGEDVQRAAQVFRQRYGREPRPGELDSLTLGTRGSKSAATSTDVSAAWRALGAEHNQTAQRTEELFNDWGLRHEAIDLRAELLADVTRERSMITERELRAKAYELSAGACRPAEADRLVNELARSGELVRLEDRTWTTRSLRETEQTTLDIAKRRASENAAPVSERSLKQARREISKEIHGSLTREQREALDTITGPGGITVLIGRAGTGKGVTISTAARAWQLEGNDVIGTAVAGATAKRLQADAKLDRSMTTDSLMNGIENGRIKLGAGSVVIMDEAGMADSDRLSRLVKLTGERESKLVLAGDAAQLSSIGAGGLFKEIEGKVPTAELTEVHRARHEWERRAWEQIRAGEPGPALAQYHAHDRLHIHDTRAEATEAMVANWNETRKRTPDGQAVMITDASNNERDQINAMAQERRAQAGELGAHRVTLPEKPYGLASGDEIIFTGQYRIPGKQRVENGITGTITGASRDEDRVTIKTKEREPREVDVNIAKFSDLSLAYAVHVHKSQGLTAETSGILTGAWQTDKEHTYVAVSRAREQTQIYITREDLGEQGMDTGAIERLADRMRTSRAQEATIAKHTIEPDQLQPEHDAERAPTPRHLPDRDAERPLPRVRPRDLHDDVLPCEQPDRPAQERSENAAPASAPQAVPTGGPTPIDINQANPEDVQVSVRDLGSIKLAYSQAYDLQSHTGEQTYALFGAWQTDKEQGFVAVTQTEDRTQVHMTTEDRDERAIETQLAERIEAVIERSQAQEPNTADREANTAGREASAPGDNANSPEQDRERQPDTAPQLEAGDRDPYIDQAIQEAQERQQAYDRDTAQDRDNDHGFGIE